MGQGLLAMLELHIDLYVLIPYIVGQQAHLASAPFLYRHLQSQKQKVRVSTLQLEKKPYGIMISRTQAICEAWS